jgi:hypothetical protein
MGGRLAAIKEQCRDIKLLHTAEFEYFFPLKMLWGWIILNYRKRVSYAE